MSGAPRVWNNACSQTENTLEPVLRKVSPQQQGMISSVLSTALGLANDKKQHLRELNSFQLILPHPRTKFKIYRNIKISSTQQDKTHNVLCPVKITRHTKRQKNLEFVRSFFKTMLRHEMVAYPHISLIFEHKQIYRNSEN